MLSDPSPDAVPEAERRRDEFLLMLAHELRNPLAPLRNVLHVLRSGRADAGTLQLATDLMERQIGHISRIADDLVDAARVTRGKPVLRVERMDLAKLVRQSVEDRRGVVTAQGLALEDSVPHTPVWVRGDATRLGQALGNIIDNAVKFTPAPGTVSVRLAPDGSHAMLVVRDSGIGIDADFLPSVFDKFTQADRSLDRTRGGLGLGLAIARALVEAHGGTLQAASAGPDRGAELTLRVPREEEPAALESSSPRDTSAEEPLRVLIVEDNRDAAESLRMLLELTGHDVTVRHTGTAGVAAAKRQHPDVVLCDIGLPELDGFGVASALRSDPETSHARLIAVTGYGAEEDRARALRSGFDEHLVKPVAPDALLARLRGNLH